LTVNSLLFAGKKNLNSILYEIPNELVLIIVQFIGFNIRDINLLEAQNLGFACLEVSAKSGENVPEIRKKLLELLERSYAIHTETHNTKTAVSVL